MLGFLIVMQFYGVWLLMIIILVLPLLIAWVFLIVFINLNETPFPNEEKQDKIDQSATSVVAIAMSGTFRNRSCIFKKKMAINPMLQLNLPIAYNSITRKVSYSFITAKDTWYSTFWCTGVFRFRLLFMFQKSCLGWAAGPKFMPTW